MRHSLLWFRFRDACGHRWSVALATYAFLNAYRRGDPCVGLTVYDLRLVLVDCGLPRAEQDETLLHELMHVSQCGRNDLSAMREEDAVRAFSPRLHPVLRRVGGLSWPRRPRGITALESRARKYHEEGE